MFVYLLRHRQSGKSYVGQTTTSLTQRFAAHRWKANQVSCRRTSAIAAAIHKYGWDAFEARCLETCHTQSELDRQEAGWVCELGTLAPDGYNLRSGGFGAGRMSAQTRLKLSRAKKGRRNPKLAETRRGMKLRPDQARAFVAAGHAAMARLRSIGELSTAAEANPNAKLTWDKVHEIRRLWSTGEYSQQSIADIYGIKQVAVSRIVRNISWRED